MTPSPRRLRAVALAALALTALLGCNSGAPPLTQGPRLAKDQTLRVLLQDQPRSLDPGQTQYLYETAVLRAISEPLLKPTADMNGVVTAAAQSYDVSTNGTVFVFHLRRAAQYWDGVPVKARDFVYAWQRLIDPRLAAPNETFFASAVLNGDKVSALDPQRDAAKLDASLGTLGLMAVDDYTFQVTLSHPDPAFTWLAAMPAGAPIRQDVVAKSGDKWAAAPESLITNGPFRVTEMVANTHLKVVPNTHYWGARPSLTAIDFVVVNDGASALAKYKNGDLDTIAVQPAQAASVAGDAKLGMELVKTPSLTVFWIEFRVDAPPFNNPKLRLALAEAIDRNAFVAQIFQGQGMAAETFIPKGMHGYAPGLGSPQKFDVAQARAAMSASGVTAAQLSGVKFSYDQSSDFGKATATFVRDQLKANLGIDIALEALDTNTLSSRLTSGDFQIAGPSGWTADFPDPSNWFDYFLTTSSNNVAFYQNQQYDNFVRVASSDLQSARRDQEYQQAQQMLVADAPVAFLAQTVNWNLVRPYVGGVTTTSVDEWPGALFPSQIYISPH
ncbi:MAG TPA: peptide ABC transporter substrate-binding protein [Candidatus Dormibacteraeota bacterium]|nr:peptide ABC transporter substrate-binding protein [Candidatus Dormibacteraeota bacterium]